MISCCHPASRCTLRAPDGIRTSVLATIVFLGSVWLIHDWHRATSLVWLIYLFKRPPPVLWDYIHSRANGSSGIWRYGSSVHPELLCYIESHHPEYDSLLDVASNLGIMLGRLKEMRITRGHRHLFGDGVLDASTVPIVLDAPVRFAAPFGRCELQAGSCRRARSCRLGPGQ